MPCTKLEPDISGVCRITGTLRDDLVAGKGRQHEDIQGGKTRLLNHDWPPARASRVRFVFDLAVVGQDRAGEHLVFPVDGKLAVDQGRVSAS